MTWKRVATAAVLIPFAVALALWGSTALVSIVVALVTLLALFEYFALGEAIGHRPYRFWTATCSLLLVFVQWFASRGSAYGLPRRLTLQRDIDHLFRISPAIQDVFFLFVLAKTRTTLRRDSRRRAFFRREARACRRRISPVPSPPFFVGVEV